MTVANAVIFAIMGVSIVAGVTLSIRDSIHIYNDYFKTEGKRSGRRSFRRSAVRVWQRSGLATVEAILATYGIRDPLKVTTAYTVVSGHQRLRIAKELGFTEIPVEIVDVDEWEAEYLLIAENVERRGQAETDPIKKARIAQFLKEYWGVQHGGKRAREQNAPLKTLDDVGEAIGAMDKMSSGLWRK